MEKEVFFGEWIEFHNEEEKEAHQYLDSWIKFFIRKVPTLELISTQFIIKPNLFGIDKSSMGVKIMMRGENPDNILNGNEFK